MNYTIDVNLVKPVVQQALETLIVGENALMARVGTGTPVANVEAGYVDMVLQRTYGNAVSASGMDLTFDAATSGLIYKDAVIRNTANDKQFEIASITGAVATVTAIDGASTPVSGEFIITLPKVKEGSGRGKTIFKQGKKYTNFTEIFRADVYLSESLLASDSYDKSTYIQNQVKAATKEVYESINQALWYGIKYDGGSDLERHMGGIYNVAGSYNVVDGASGKITWAKLVKMCKQMKKVGGKPDILVAAPAQAEILTDLIYSKQRTFIGENKIGAIAQIFLDPITGNEIEIVYDDNCPSGDIWFFESAALEWKPLNGRDLIVADASANVEDARGMKIISEKTLFIHNAPNKVGHISNLTLA